MIAGDASGLSDPFIASYFYGTEAKTTVAKDTVNPVNRLFDIINLNVG